MKFFSRLRLRQKLVAIFLLVGLVPAAVIGGLALNRSGDSLQETAFGQLQTVREIKKNQVEAYFQQRQEQMSVLVDTVDTIRAEAFEKLRGIQSMKQSQLERFFAERYADVSVLAANATVGDALDAFEGSFTAEGGRVGGPGWKAAAERYSPWLEEYQRRYGYYDLFLVSAAGDVVYSVAGESDLGADLVSGALAGSGLGEVFADARQQPAIADFAPYAPSGGAQASFIAAPVHRGGELLGVVALQVPLRPINAIVQDRSGLGRTGESYLVGRAAQGDSLRSDRVVEGEGQWKVGHPVVERFGDAALDGRSGVTVKTDTAGQLKAVAYAPLEIAGLHWALLTTQQLEEIFTGSAVTQGQDSFLARYQARYGYYDLFLIHPEGDVFYTVAREADYGTNLLSGKFSDSGLGELFRRVRESGEFGLQDFAPYAPSNGEPAAFLAQPLVRDGKVELVVALQLPLEHINAIMQQRDGMGSTGETYLVGPDQRMRSDSYLDPQAHSVQASFAGTVEANGVVTEASRAALAGETGAAIISDYNGNPVLSAFAPVSVGATNWALLAEIDEAEAFAAISDLQSLMAVTAVVTVLAVVATALWVGHSIASPIGRAVEVARTIASGDLTSRIVVDRKDEVGDMLEAMKRMNERLLEIVGDVRESTGIVSSAATEVSQGSTDLSQRTEEQASSLEETASSMEEMTATVKQNAEHAAQADQLSTGAREKAERGGEVARQMVSAMSDISQSSKRIADIIGVIDEIAFQTNLLALNAAVEAARAGEQGRGFAVVAGEVRKLAQRSSDSAKEIRELILSSAAKVEDGGKLVEQSGANLEEIVTAVKKVSDIVAEISAASQEQSSGIDQVNKAVMQMDEVTQQNAALVEETAASSESMRDQADRLVELISFFKLAADGAAAQPVARVESRSAAPKAAAGGAKAGTARGTASKPAARPQPANASAAASRPADPAPAKAGADDEWEEF